MQEVKAYVRTYMLDRVIDALAAIPGLAGVAVVNLREFGRASGNGGLASIEMVKLEIDVPDELAEVVIDTVVEHARTAEGHPGDGRVFVSELREAVRIGDGRRGDAALRG